MVDIILDLASHIELLPTFMAVALRKHLASVFGRE